MDFTIIKDKLVYFTLFKRTSRFRKYLSLISWLFLIIVPILDNEFFGNNIQQLNITTNITLTILLFITLKIYHFYQSSSSFILKSRIFTISAANEMAIIPASLMLRTSFITHIYNYNKNFSKQRKTKSPCPIS